MFYMCSLYPTLFEGRKMKTIIFIKELAAFALLAAGTYAWLVVA